MLSACKSLRLYRIEFGPTGPCAGLFGAAAKRSCRSSARGIFQRRKQESLRMAGPRTVDTHTHVLTEETMALLNKELPKAAIKLTPIDQDFATLEVAGVPYKPFPRGGFDIE